MGGRELRDEGTTDTDILGWMQEYTHCPTQSHRHRAAQWTRHMEPGTLSSSRGHTVLVMPRPCLLQSPSLPYHRVTFLLPPASSPLSLQPHRHHLAQGARGLTRPAHWTQQTPSTLSHLHSCTGRPAMHGHVVAQSTDTPTVTLLAPHIWEHL